MPGWKAVFTLFIHLDRVNSWGMSEKLCLKWNDFQNNTNKAFGSLRNNNDFSDVTLVCKDGQKVEAHKVILAASSPFFQNLLRRNKHPHPLIYMRGMKSEDLEAIVDFLYYGEASVYENDVETFFEIAEELNLRGLNRNAKNIPHEFHPDKELAPPSAPQFKTQRPKAIQTNPIKYQFFENKTSFGGEDSKANLDDTILISQKLKYDVSRIDITDVNYLEETVRSMMIKSQNYLSNTNGTKARADICTICGKEGKRTNIKDHIEANHLEGVSIPCKSCEKTFKSRKSLRYHNLSCMI